MKLKSKQGVLLKIDKFANGSECKIPRTFLVIETDEIKKEVTLLNVSKIEGKNVSKLLMPSNKQIKKFKPPYMLPSFVKLDEVYILQEQEWFFPLANGLYIDNDEFAEILSEFENYSCTNQVYIVRPNAEKQLPVQIKNPIKQSIVNTYNKRPS